jgi:hypothetical protein
MLRLQLHVYDLLLESMSRAKVVPLHAVKAYGGSGGLAPYVINLGARWNCMIIFTLRPLYPRGKSLRHQLNRRLVEAPPLSEGFVEEENLFPLLETEPWSLGRPGRGQITVTASVQTKLALCHCCMEGFVPRACKEQQKRHCPLLLLL